MTDNVEITADDLFAQLKEAYERLAVLEVQNRTLLRTVVELRQPEPTAVQRWCSCGQAITYVDNDDTTHSWLDADGRFYCASRPGMDALIFHHPVGPEA